MTTVDRYDFDLMEHRRVRGFSGPWVRYEDYTAQASRIKELEGERDRQREVTEYWADVGQKANAYIARATRAEALLEQAKAAVTERIAWHKCSCPEPCDDYNVFPGGCAARYAADYRTLLTIISSKGGSDA